MATFNTLKALTLLSGLLLMSPVRAEFSRQYIHAVGASGSIPALQLVGSRLLKAGKLKQLPRLEATGTRGGITLFCEGNGNDSPDMLIIADALKKKAFDSCLAHGVDRVVEVRIGYDALVLVQAGANAVPPLSRHDLGVALAAQTGSTPNVTQNWQQINPALPDRRIGVLGPPLLSGSSEALLDIVTRSPTCQPDTTPAAVLRTCRRLREDGVYQEYHEHDAGILAELLSAPWKLAIVDYKLYLDNGKKVAAIPLDGVKPETSTLANQTYPLVRPVHLYIKAAQVAVIPGLKAFLAELTHEKAWGDKGYLSALGLVPLTAAERQAYALKVRQLDVMPPPSE